MLYLISAPYYQHINDWLEEGAVRACEEAGISYKIIRVTGALEIPQAIQTLRDKADGFVALGCVIRGETSHYDIVCETSALGLQRLALDFEIPITNGILTVENKRQAEYRAHPGRGNKGGFAVDACLQLLALKSVELDYA